MRPGETPRVERLLAAYRLIYYTEPSTSQARIEALKARIHAVLPQLTKAETHAYYVGVRRMHEMALLKSGPGA